MPMMITEMNAMACVAVGGTASPSRFRRRARRASVEALMAEIGALTSERQQLRDGGAAARKLERNRVKLARKQWELSLALIERYLPGDDSRAA
jgi:hypothetical protein